MQIDVIDRLIELLARALEALAPVVQMASHPYSSGIGVVSRDRVGDHAVRLDEAWHRLLNHIEDQFGRREVEQYRRFARELKPAILSRLGDQRMPLVVDVQSRSVVESAIVIPHFGRFYGADTSRQRQDDARRQNCNTAIAGFDP